MEILVVKLSSLGDLFHALPAVHALKTGLNAEIDWVTQPEYEALVRCFTDVRETLCFPRRGGPADWRAFVRRIRARRYDLVVDLQGLLKSAIVARLARAPMRVGPSFQREGARFLYTALAGRRNPARHAVEQNLDVVRFLGLPAAPAQFPVRFPPAPLAAPRPRVAVFPCSRWVTKNWPLPCFEWVARSLAARAGARIYVLGGAGDAPACARLAGAVGAAAENLAGRLDLVATGSLLQEMDLALANDSGPCHMAAALGIPTLAVFGPTDARRTGPFGRPHRVLAATLDCQPCFSRACRRGDLGCLAGVTPERVADAALEMLARR